MHGSRPLTVNIVTKCLRNTSPSAIREALRAEGYALIRGINDLSAERFEEIVGPVIAPYMPYTTGTVAREKLSQWVTTTGLEGVAHIPVPLHVEMPYADRWAKYICFACLRAPPRGSGLTLLASNRWVTDNLDPHFRARLLEQGVLYTRFLPSNRSQSNFFASWQKAFETQDRAEAEQMCRELGHSVLWDENDNLQLSFKKPGFIEHSDTGLPLLFNEIYLQLIKQKYPEHEFYWSLPKEKRPIHLRWGDGTEFSDGEIEKLAEVMESRVLGVEWEAGDILLIENEVMFHGRTPYDPSAGRKLGVLMGTPVYRSNLEQLQGISKTHTG